MAALPLQRLCMKAWTALVTSSFSQLSIVTDIHYIVECDVIISHGAALRPAKTEQSL
jgi:hypothetical protein